MKMDNNQIFKNNIEELSLNEVESIAGGPVPILLGIAYLGIGLSTGTLIAGGGFLVGLELSKH